MTAERMAGLEALPGCSWRWDGAASSAATGAAAEQPWRHVALAAAQMPCSGTAEARDARWRLTLAAVKAFLLQQEGGRYPWALSSDPAERRLGSWLKHQKTVDEARGDGRWSAMSAERAAGLETLPGWRWLPAPTTNRRVKPSECPGWKVEWGDKWNQWCGLQSIPLCLSCSGFHTRELSQ